METWIPLLVALVAAVAAVGVAFWNSRGESAELRQLKAINEAIHSMPVASAHTLALTDARDGLAVRVAVRITAAPVRRRWGWVLVGWVSTYAILCAVVLLTTPLREELGVNVPWLEWGALIAAAIGLAGVWVWLRTSATEQARVSRRLTAEILADLARPDGD